MDAPVPDRLVRLVLDALAPGHPVEPVALQFLLRRYAATGDEAIGRAVGPALARVLALPCDAGQSIDRAARLSLIVDAASVTDDDRIGPAATDLARALRSDWLTKGGGTASLPGVEACLRSLPLVDAPGLAAAAVDELERTIREGYRPGGGMAGAATASGPASAALLDQVVTARTLLTAFDVTGRLPYAMLADDLMRFARRSSWDEDRGGYQGAGGSEDGGSGWFLASCAAASVLCRLAALYRDDDYRRGAVIAADADHAADTRSVLERLAPVAEAAGLAAAAYGLALDEAGLLL